MQMQLVCSVSRLPHGYMVGMVRNKRKCVRAAPYDDVLSIGAQVKVGLDDVLGNVNNWIVMSYWSSHERCNEPYLMIRPSDGKKCEDFMWLHLVARNQL